MSLLESPFPTWNSICLSLFPTQLTLLEFKTSDDLSPWLWAIADASGTEFSTSEHNPLHVCTEAGHLISEDLWQPPFWPHKLDLNAYADFLTHDQFLDDWR